MEHSSLLFRGYYQNLLPVFGVIIRCCSLRFRGYQNLLHAFWCYYQMLFLVVSGILSEFVICFLVLLSDFVACCFGLLLEFVLFFWCYYQILLLVVSGYYQNLLPVFYVIIRCCSLWFRGYYQILLSVLRLSIVRLSIPWAIIIPTATTVYFARASKATKFDGSQNKKKKTKKKIKFYLNP